MSANDLEALRPDLLAITGAPADREPAGSETQAVNALRFLAVDAVERAGSGHPGAPLGLAPLAYRLFTRHLRHAPADPAWPDRDRFVLSNGHASLLLYGALHLSGYDLSLDDLRSFRRWDSRTPGHPERGRTPGVEVTTGPLGQGMANAVGMAMAERMLAARFNRPSHAIVDHRTWAICGDGDMMEGISSEAASLAGHLGLGKLTLFYDDNHITLEGAADVEFSENVRERFRAYGWHVTEVPSVLDLAAIDVAIEAACGVVERPTLIVVGTHIGFGSPLQDTARAHGSPLGAENVAATRERLGWPYPPFELPEEVVAHWRTQVAERARERDAWLAQWDRYREAHAALASELERMLAGRLPEDWRAALPSFLPGDRIATRKSAGEVLNALANVVPELVGGAADVGTSTDTQIRGSGDVNCGDWTGDNIHFGVREHAMGAICNGIAAHGGLRPYCATFFAFVDYMREAVRLAALMRLPVVFVFTHDSIGLGEDGPTHQPVEQLAGLRAMPGLHVIRPADANESVGAWAEALAHDGPTVLVLSRQALGVLDPSVVDVARGASVVAPGGDAVLLATGSEVELALGARERLRADSVEARVVSLSCWEIFRQQAPAFRASVLPPAMPSLAVEAASPLGWREFADDAVALDRFGASAPARDLAEQFGFTPEAIARRMRVLLGKEASES